MMSSLELDRLEEDVAKARERVVTDVARLRSPAAMAEFRADIGHTLSDGAQRTVENLKNRAAANPAAVLAIAAGLLWRFARHPPIASLLVGVGLTSLLRTSSDSPPSPVVTRSGELLHAANERASELSEQARALTAQAREAAAATAATVSQTAERVADQAAQAAARVSERSARLSEDARETATRVSGQAADTAARMSGQAAEAAARMSEGAGQIAAQASRSADRFATAAQQVLREMSARDGFLLGVAALAVGTAALIGLRRGEA
jgi:chemotaxis protein histidine kinase CheA